MSGYAMGDMSMADTCAALGLDYNRENDDCVLMLNAPTLTPSELGTPALPGSASVSKVLQSSISRPTLPATQMTFSEVLNKYGVWIVGGLGLVLLLKGGRR